MYTLSEVRKTRGITQESLADLTGIHQPNIAAIENGRILPSKVRRSKIESILGIEIDWIQTRLQAAGDGSREIVGQILAFVHSTDSMSKNDKVQFLTDIIQSI